MYRICLLLLTVLLLLASCSEHPHFVRNDVQVCQTEGFTGYFVPDGNRSHGLLYIDRGRLFAEEHRVEVSELFGRTYVKGEELGRTRCTLSRYSNPAAHPVAEGVDYLHPHYGIVTTREVEYGRATGLWTSYPYDNSGNYGRIVMGKLEDLIRNEQEEQSLRLDIYAPDDGGNRLRPLLVMIHEGAFFSGDKADDASMRWCERFASCGYVAVSVNYRLGFNLLSSSVPEAAYCALQDVNAALRYLLAHGADYRIDPDEIFLAGCSAGAILALNTAFLTDSNLPAPMQDVAARFGPLSAIRVTHRAVKDKRIELILVYFHARAVMPFTHPRQTSATTGLPGRLFLSILHDDHFLQVIRTVERTADGPIMRNSDVLPYGIVRSVLRELPLTE